MATKQTKTSPKDLILVGFKIEKSQRDALQDEALRRQRERGGRMDVSEVVRDVIAAWLKRKE